MGKNKQIFIEKATVDEFKHYCMRFCRLCTAPASSHLIEGSFADSLITKDDRATSCPLIRFEAYRRLMRKGGVNAVSLHHTEVVKEIMQEIDFDEMVLRNGRNVY